MSPSVGAGTCSFGDPAVTTTRSHSGTYAAEFHYTMLTVDPCPAGTSTAHQDRNIYYQKDYGAGNGYTTFSMGAWVYQATPVTGTSQLQRKMFYTNPSLGSTTPDYVVTSDACDAINNGIRISYNGGAGFTSTSMYGSDSEIQPFPGVCNAVALWPFDQWCYWETFVQYKSGVGALDSAMKIWRYCPLSGDSIPIEVFRKTNTWKQQFVISSASRVSNVTTFTTSSAHGYSNGKQVHIYAMADSTFNFGSGSAQNPCSVTVTGATTFTCATTGLADGSSSGGQVGEICSSGRTATCPAFPEDAQVANKTRIYRFGNQVDRVTLIQFDETRNFDDIRIGDNWMGPN